MCSCAAHSPTRIAFLISDTFQRHQVCYEVWPENLVVNRQLVKVGFALELEGTHEHPGSEVLPGCVHCQDVFTDDQIGCRYATCLLCEGNVKRQGRTSWMMN